MKFSEYIKSDRIEYKIDDKRFYFNKLINHEHEITIWKYIVLLRKEEYWDKRNNRILSTIYRRKKNKLGEKIGFTIPKNTLGTGVHIWHYGNIVINAFAKIGSGCNLHGDNCIGNKGIFGDPRKNPIIGNNVDIGVGAKIIGDITIADNIVIAAGAVVTKSCYDEGAVLAGVPAKIIKNISIEKEDLK